MSNSKDLEHRFAFHPASDEEKRSAHGSVRQICLDAALRLDERMPEGREKALVFTKLEEAMFWANAAIAREA